MSRLKLPLLSDQTMSRFAPAPVAAPAPSTKTRMFTYFTIAGETKLLYSAETWVRANLFLEDAGPVSVGTDQNLAPVLSGKGILLPTNIERGFYLSKGDRIFILAEAVNRVQVVIEPLPPGLMNGGGK